MVLNYLHWFNPENDLALAADVEHYTPPRGALALHRAGAVLPLWYGAPGDKVLCYGVDARWLERVARDFSLRASIFDHRVTSGLVARPWGWSAYARRRYLTEGFDAASLPSPERLAVLRGLSHRRTAADICRRLRQALPGVDLAEPAMEMSDMESLRRLLAADPAVVLKAPWSSSGRGIVDARLVPEHKVLQQAEDAIRHQGSVMVEKAYDKVVDFARLYECRGGRCHDLGTSVFTTDSRGAYRGNLLAPEAVRVGHVARHLPADTLSEVAEALRVILEETVAPVYDGILGMDMLVDSRGMLDATVELNLRCTMGYVANRFAEAHMLPGVTGEFRVVLAEAYTPDIYDARDGRLASGTLNLTPPGGRFSFLVRTKES